MKIRTSLVAIAAFASVTSLAACGAPEKKADDSSASAATAASADDLGGLGKLQAAAEKEGALTTIALPHDWANYGKIIDGFKAKYPKIKVTELNPGAGSQDEVDAIKGLPNDPDVLDVGQAVAYANFDKFAPYKVANFDTIPDNLKDPDGTVVNDYSGYMAIGYDSSKVPAITSLDDLLKPAYKGKVVFSGDPTTSAEGANSVLYAALIKGGSTDDIQPGLDFMKQMKKAGTFNPVEVSKDTLANGTTPVVFGWGYNQLSYASAIPTWKVWASDQVGLAGPYFQAINKDAPHPAAARLWEEYLYSDDVQNLFLAGGAVPARIDDMTKAGSVDSAAQAALPNTPANVTVPTVDQTEKVGTQLAAGWAKAIG
ncbi:ABC transporter substrate-binding protein [Nocardioides sp. Kera G14]|uniref:ABC transporter substrate-binding protein n=1 Tax=Nocardioides sp. Kera G14 TaxID=2884264 RepID=UPI001D116454|nr:ABC transporter substrate-binding protein [Nocardioides sp. Kera G14]UDY22908.1 ABC transporter substrate-binding protein [Nocardioides sp. Kera G14]